MSKLETRFKKGDKVVRIADSISEVSKGNHYIVSDDMCGDLHLEGCKMSYDSNYFELVKENKEMFDINDLETGMRIKDNRGYTGIILKDIGVVAFEGGGYINIENYCSNFTHVAGSRYNIIEVYQGFTKNGRVLDFKYLGDLLWKYEEESPQQKRIKELEQTIAQASQQIAALKEEMK